MCDKGVKAGQASSKGSSELGARVASHNSGAAKNIKVRIESSGQQRLQKKDGTKSEGVPEVHLSCSGGDGDWQGGSGVASAKCEGVRIARSG